MGSLWFASFGPTEGITSFELDKGLLIIFGVVTSVGSFVQLSLRLILREVVIDE
jgi:hypothetical protein